MSRAAPRDASIPPGSADGRGAAGEPGGTAESRSFRDAYAQHRAREGRGPLAEEELLALPYLTSGRFAHEWRVRARSFDAFVRRVLEPLARGTGRPLHVLDLGAGNGWLSYRVVRMGHRSVAVDVRTDHVDGLGAAAAYVSHVKPMFGRSAASFERLPFAARVFDAAVFNASLHYALDLARVLTEAARVVRQGGRLAVVDSPFYRLAEAGETMAAEKRRAAPQLFGELAGGLEAPSFVEYLTRDRLERASGGAGWRRVRVRYPLWYEARPWIAKLRGRREPSRFDVWWTQVG